MQTKRTFVIPPPELLDMVYLDPSSPSYLSWKLKPKGHCGDDLTIRSKTTSKFTHVYYYCIWKKKQYFAHKIVYILANNISHNEVKNLPIDHIDRNTLNNHPSNLREASFSINRKNSNSTSSTGYKGIYKCYRRGKYEIQLRKNDVCRTFGTKISLDDAIMTYIKAHHIIWPDEHLPDEYIEWCKISENIEKLKDFVLIDNRRETTKYCKRKYITYAKNEDRWHAFHTIDNKKIFLGGFKTEEDAIKAQDFAIKHNRIATKEELTLSQNVVNP